MKNNGLPAGANQWARDVESAMATLGQLQEIARRICTDFGLDIANPTRGLNAGSVPSVQNPVQLKLPSLQDLDIRDAQDGDLLTFDGATGNWVARRHNVVQLPKQVLTGDPDSYYVEPPDEEPPTDGDWFAPLFDTNHVLDPSFEQGMSGWTMPAFSGSAYNAAKSLSYAPGAGIDGGSAIKIVTAGDVASDQLNYAFYELPNTLTPGQVSVSVRSDTSADAYASIVNYDSTGAPLLESGVSTLVVGAEHGWQSVIISPPWQEFANPEGVKRYLLIRIGGNYTQTYLEDAEFFVDHVSLSAKGTYFDGGTAADDQFTYGWEGTPNASRSVKTPVKELQMPTTITLGQEFTIKGRNFPASTEISIRDDWFSAFVTVTTDSTGTFETTLTVPPQPDGPEPGPGYLIIDSGWGQETLNPDVTYI